MNRRACLRVFGGLLVSGLGIGAAQPLENRFPRAQYLERGWRRWDVMPDIVVISEPGDDRIAAVHEAVNFWNAELIKFGCWLRLGRIDHIADRVPAEDARRRAHRELDERLKEDSEEVAWLLAQVDNLGGDIVIALSRGRVSFAASMLSSRKFLVVIRDLSLSGIGPADVRYQRLTRNIVAHEFGHAIGLNHNDDENALMCTPCNYDGLVHDGFRPLSEGDKWTLREWYPPSWQDIPWRWRA